MDEKKALELFDRGTQFKQEEKIQEAIDCYQCAIELNPNCHIYYYQLANILREQGQLVRATIYYRQAIELNSNDSWSYYSLGEILTKQEKIQEAIECYRRAIELNPDYSWSYYNLARILHQQGQTEAAIQYYQITVRLNPNYSWAYHFLGDILTETKKFELAIANYQQAIKFNANFNLSFYQLGYNLHKQKRYTEAIECYQQAIDLQPNHFWSYYHLAEAYTITENITQAIRSYQQALDLNPKFLQVAFQLGQLLLNYPELELETYRESLSNKSNLVKAYFEIGLGQAWQEKQQFDRAINCYQQAIQIDSTLELPYKLLQYIFYSEEQIDLLIQLYRDVLEKHPNIAIAWSNLGDMLSKQDRLTSAIDCYRKSCYYNAIEKDLSLGNLDWNNSNITTPNFIILGSAKCGTTSLFEYLKQHPQILLPHKKEIDFFTKYFHRGKKWYLSHFPPICNGKTNFITGEATTHYFDNFEVDLKIKEMFPNTKLIIMLRNPIDRTISDYYHHLNRGIETRTIPEIVSETRSYLKTTTCKNLQYRRNEFDYIIKSIYYPKIKRWLELFSQNQMLILESESFFKDPKNVMIKVFEFLELAPHSFNEYSRYNTGFYSKIEPNLIDNLEEIFYPFNRQLEEYLNRHFNW
jgi:tetratricopeptide (TPR) repeat protein